MMGGAYSPASPPPQISTEARPMLIEQRLRELLDRLNGINETANRLCIMLTGQSALSPEVAGNSASPPNLGLYSNIFMAIDSCMGQCHEIELSLKEAGR